MTYREIAAEIKRLPIDQRLLLLEELLRSLRFDMTATMQQPSAPRLWRGMLRSTEPMPSVEELEDAYPDHLAEKHLRFDQD